jgi:hypothetical protein
MPSSKLSNAQKVSIFEAFQINNVQPVKSLQIYSKIKTKKTKLSKTRKNSGPKHFG